MSFYSSNKENIPPEPNYWTKIDNSWIPYINKAYTNCQDFNLAVTFSDLYNTPEFSDYSVIKDKEGGLTVFKTTKNGSKRLCIPSKCRQQMEDGSIKELRETLIDQAHTTLGHASAEKTNHYLMDYFWWPGMRRDTKEFCKQCDNCQHTKFSTKAPQGLARPLPVPQKPFTHISMDFLTLPPKVRKEGNTEVTYDSVWVIVDRFSALKKLIPTNKEVTSQQLTTMFMDKVYPDWGMPNDIVSDRDTKLTAKPWTDFCKQHHINQSLSTAYRPRTDGQTEVANKAIVQMIKSYNYEGNTNWLHHLPTFQAILNRTQDSSRKATPFEIAMGHNPRLIGDIAIQVPATPEQPSQRVKRIKLSHQPTRINIAKAKINQATDRKSVV